MKTKNTIQIVETPIIDKYDFHENNGIINPAFLESHPEEEDTNSSQPLVVSDYRQCFHHNNSLSAVQYPTDDLIIEHRPNGTSVASSWVYEFNNPSSSNSNSPGHNMSHSPSSFNGMYRSYGTGYNDHLSYEMDLSREHRKNAKTEERCLSDGCWPTCVKLFVWTVIVVCLMGVLLSVAFIIYIENFAPDSCCSDPITNSTGTPHYQWINDNTTTQGLDHSSENISNSTPAPVGMTSVKSQLTTEIESETSPKLTTNSFLGTNDNNSSSDLSMTTNQSQELNVTDVPSDMIPETSEVVSTSPTTALLTKQTATHSTPTSMPKIESTTSAAPTPSTPKPIITTETPNNSSFDSRFLTTNSSQIPKQDINSTESKASDQINSHKSATNSLATTLSPEETTAHNSNETTTREPDIVAEIVGELERDPTLDPTSDDNSTTSAAHSESDTSSTVSDYTTANYNQTEPAINLKESVDNKDSITNTTSTETSIATTLSTKGANEDTQKGSE